MKLFKTNNLAIVHHCTVYFNFKLPCVLIVSRHSKFLIMYKDCENYLFNLIAKLTVQLNFLTAAMSLVKKDL
jgi:hypothetical protein